MNTSMLLGWAVCAAAAPLFARGQAVSFGMSKAVDYLQTGDGVVTPYNDWNCVLSIAGDQQDAFSDCSITYAGPLSPITMGIVANTPEYGQVWYGYVGPQPTLAALDSDVPPGDYAFSFTGNVMAGGTHIFTVLPSAFCDEIPELLDDTYSRLQVYKDDLSADFTGSMSGFVDNPGANSSSVSFVIYQAGRGLFWSGSLPPDATSFTIPGGTLDSGRAYFGVMYYTVSFGDPGAGISGGGHANSFSRNVTFYFNTRGSCPADLNGDGFVDDADFVIFVQGYNLLYCFDEGMPEKCPADLTNDGYVLDDDFVAFVPAYDQLLCEP